MNGDWRDSAACKDQAHLFFAPGDGESRDDRLDRLAEAKALCGACPVRADCLAFAVSRETRHGIWGQVDFGEPRPRQKAARTVAAA